MNTNLENLIKQFNAEQFPSDILDTLSTFYADQNQLIAESIADSPSTSIDDESTHNDCINNKRNASINELKSIIDQTTQIPDHFSKCTEYYDKYFSKNDNSCCSKKCYRKFPKQLAFQSHLNSLELDKYCSKHVNHQHLFLLGAMNSLLQFQDDSNCNNSSKGKKRKSTTDDINNESANKHSSKRIKSSFRFQGKEICRSYFLYLFGCGLKRYKNVLKQFLNNHHSNQDDHIDRPYQQSINNKSNINYRQRLALIFIQNYAQQLSLQLPGCFVCDDDDGNNQYKDLYLLPNNFNQTRRNIYEHYSNTSMNVIKIEPLSYALWNELWNLYYPNIQTYSHRRYPCNICRNYGQSKLSNVQAKNIENIKDYIKHLNAIDLELKNYQSIISECQTIYQQYLERIRQNKDNQMNENLKESFQSTLPAMHYTIEWFTTISIPVVNNRKEIYFENGYKIALFSIMIEPIKKFIIYLIPEFICHQTNDLFDIIISLLQHLFTNHQFGEQKSIMHISNGQQQFKSNLKFFLSYFQWRLLIGKNDRIQISFLPTAHSYCCCWNNLFMGHIKKKLCNCNIESINDLKIFIDNCCSNITSTHTNNNEQPSIQTYLVGDDHQQILIPLYDWKQKLIPFIDINLNDRILIENDHFEFDVDLPDYVACRKVCNAQDTESYRILMNDKLSLINESLPSKLTMQPLADERIKYLFDKIRPFVHNDSDSIIMKMSPLNDCKYDNHKQDDDGQQNIDNHIIDKHTEKDESKTQTIQKYQCGYCRQYGHREHIYGNVCCPIKRNDANLFKLKKSESSRLINQTGQDLAKSIGTSADGPASTFNDEYLSDNETEQLLSILEMNHDNFDDDDSFDDENEDLNVDENTDDDDNL